MPPPRRRGANKAKANGHLRLGDLVLAKVKGFPYWPAMISRPEDWEKIPDPKKYFVQFFGTKEIAFVAPADIQAFTNETKTKLSARCQGKTKYFTKAVKEICAAFEELEKQKASGLKEDTDDSRIGSRTPVVGVVAPLKDAADAVVLNIEKTNTYVGDVGSNLEQCTQRCEESGSQSAKPSLSGRPIDSASPVLSPVLESKPSIGEELNKHSSKSDLDEQSCLKVEVSDIEDVCNVNDLKQADYIQNVSTNGNNSRRIVTGSRRSKIADDRKRSGEISRAFLKDESCAGYAGLSRSGEKLKDKKRGKDSLSVKSGSLDAPKSDSDINSGSKNNNLLKVKTGLKVKNELQDSFVCLEAERKKSFKQNKTQVHGKRNLGTNETSHATKKLKCMDNKDNKTSKSLLEDGNSVLPSSPIVDEKEFKQTEFSRSTSRLKTEKRLPSRGQISIVGSDYSVGELLPDTKYHTQVQQGMPDSASGASGGHSEMSSLRLKGDTSNLTIKQVKRRRRAVCVSDDDDDDEPKTPVHGGAAKDIKSPLVSEVMKSSDTLLENTDVAQLATKKPSALEDIHFKESTSELHNDNLSAGNPQKETDEVISVQLPHSPGRLGSKQLPPKVVDKLSSISPVKSPHSLCTTKSNAEQHKSSKRMLHVSSNSTQKKVDNGSSKNLNTISSSPSQVTTHKKKPASSAETSKTTPKTLPQAVEVPVTTENLKEFDAFRVDRIEVGMEEKSSLYTVSRTPETAKTMKNLIAAAQAKRRQVAQAQCHPLSIYYTQGGTPSPSTFQPFLSVSNNIDQTDWQGVLEYPTLGSPSTNGYQSISQNQPDAEENEEKRVSPVQKDVRGSLSGGTDAAIARDAFEGMIETLSRTKESIGRATRLAIDCAKYGIANEVVQLLIRKLENETSFHRKVDLFFLVDSITQCSHNQKGIAGASYIPTVQGGLPRLLSAAAPPGASASENRRQCLKVLRLWLERKIFPESVLRRYMDDMTVSCSFRRPSRAERSLDDPIRELEDIFVDEYGSNTFQLPGFLSSCVFEEDEDNDFPDNASPADATRIIADSETSTVTPSDKRHCVLEDVDGELEMEDVSGHLKEERPLLLNSPSEKNSQLQGSERILDPASNISAEIPDILEGSPPLPLDSPPSPPPLPSSPPPPPLPPPSPPPSLISQSSGPAQPPLFSQTTVPPQSLEQSSPLSGCQHSVPHDFSGSTNGNQIVQVAGNSLPGSHNSSVVKNEILQQPSACFPPMAGCNSQEPSGFNPPRQLEYGQNDMYLNSQGPQPNVQFQPANPPFAPRHMHPALPQNSSNQYSYPKPTIPQHLPHSFHPPFSLPSVPDGQRQFGTNEQWRMPSSEFITNNQQGLWMGRNPSCPGPPFGQEGFFRPPLERPPINNVGFQHANPSNIPARPLTGHGVPQMLSCRPDIPALNFWRPT